MNQNASNEPIRVLSARWVVPVSRAPIHGGWIRMVGKRVIDVGSGNAPSEAVDLGDVAILPGLVNAHTHLEFSDCKNPIGEKGVALHDWIGQVIEARGGTSALSRQQAIAAGIAESVAAGTRLIGEITTPPCDYDLPSSIDLVSFAEVLGLTPERSRERFLAATEHNGALEYAAWSPHAPYSTAWHAIEACVEAAKSSARPLAMHVAESAAERELITSGSGPMADVLRRLGVWRDGLFPWSNNPTCNPVCDLIRLLANAPRALLVHGNDLRDKEIDQIGKHANLTVVVCPRTHAFFGYEKHPVAKLQNAGVRVALGTDSRASNPDLNLWREIQHFLLHRSDLRPETVVAMGTINGAEALGVRGCGRIEVDCVPGIGAVDTTATNEEQLYRDFAANRFLPIPM